MNAIHPNNLSRTILVGQKLGSPPPVDAAEPGVIFPDRKEGVFQLTFDQMSRGTLLLGGTGSGKSNVFFHILQQTTRQMTENDLMLVFDPKGEFSTFLEETLGPDTRLVWISSAPEHAGITSHWNIYEELLCAETVEESELMARELANTLFADQIKGSNQPFFGIAAAELFAFLLIAELRKARSSKNYRPLNNSCSVQFLHGATVDTFHTMIDEHPDFRYLEAYLGRRGQNLTPQALGVLGVLYSGVNRTLIGPFRQTGKAFSMARLCKERGRYSHGTVVVLRYTVRHKQTLETVLSLLVTQFIKEALSRGDGDGGDTYLILDELAMVPHIGNLQDACNFGRSRGLKIVCGLQSITQLQERYGDAALPIAAGFSSCIALRCVDQESRNYVSKRFGDSFETLSWAGNQIPHESHTVRDCDQRDLTVGVAYVDLPGHDPFRFEFQKFQQEGG